MRPGVTSSPLLAVATGSGLALASFAHCAVMCGPVAMAAHARGGRSASVTYFAGRLVSYGLLGSMVGSLGRVLFATPLARWAEALLSWLLAATLLFTAAMLLRTPRRAEMLVSLGRAPRAPLLGRVLARLADEPLLLGAATALLPCGALFAALAGAAAQGNAALGALSMLSFALVTGLVVVGVAELGALRRSGPGLRRLLALALLIGGAILVVRPLPTLRAAEGELPACHAPAAGAAGVAP